MKYITNTNSRKPFAILNEILPLREIDVTVKHNPYKTGNTDIALLITINMLDDDENRVPISMEFYKTKEYLFSTKLDSDVAEEYLHYHKIIAGIIAVTQYDVALYAIERGDYSLIYYFRNNPLYDIDVINTEDNHKLVTVTKVTPKQSWLRKLLNKILRRSI